MTAVALGIVLALQLGGSSAQTTLLKPAEESGVGCLELLIGWVLLSILSYSLIRIGTILQRSGKEKADFTSLRSTGKTIVNSTPSDVDEDSNSSGAVN